MGETKGNATRRKMHHSMQNFMMDRSDLFGLGGLLFAYLARKIQYPFRWFTIHQDTKTHYYHVCSVTTKIGAWAEKWCETQNNSKKH